MTKRLFIGIPVPEKIKDELVQIAIRNSAVPHTRWYPVSNFHITVLFMGDVDRERIREIQARLSTFTEQQRSFDIEFEAVVPWPPNRPFMIWAKYKASDEFTGLCHTLSQILSTDLEHPERIPHITLARFKKLKNMGSFDLDATVCKHHIRVQNLTLWESQLRSTGAIHKAISHVDLA